MGVKINLKTIDREALLDTRLCDLALTIQGTWLQQNISKLHQELQQKEILLLPHVWISDDWFSPDGISGFALPFFLLHPRLMAIEREMIGEAEGGDRTWCMMLMRHEAGHCIDNAFHLRKNKTRQSLFGLTSTPYPDSYRPNPHSRQFVRHLDGYYAQAHPDEDWAETFAVWLTPRSAWRKRYASWPVALKKLEHLHSLMTSIQGKKPLISKRNRRKKVDELSTIKKTLREHYQEKRRHLGLNKPPLFKGDLCQIFTKKGELAAWKFVHKSKEKIIDQVAKNTRLQHYKIKIMLREIQNTCRQEGLMIDHPSPTYRQKVINLMTKKSEGFIKDNRSRIIM